MKRRLGGTDGSGEVEAGVALETVVPGSGSTMDAVLRYS